MSQLTTRGFPQILRPRETQNPLLLFSLSSLPFICCSCWGLLTCLGSMDVHPNASCSATSSLFGELVPHAMEGGEEGSLEWLSIYVEDCLSSTPSYIISSPPHAIAVPHHHQSSTPTSNPPPQQAPVRKPSFHDPPVPGKARTKRRRLTPSSLSLDAGESFFSLAPSEPLLHHQTCWLADSELLLPRREEDNGRESALQQGAATDAAAGARGGGEEEEEEEKMRKQEEGMELVQGKRCSHCLSQKTPQWRAGPLGPKTLCNACGVRFKSGRLLPEYRPAKSPTFVSYKHSNSHKKVMEMRMALLSSTTSYT